MFFQVEVTHHLTLWVLILYRHMLNVTWEHNDFSFNSNGYLVNPAMIIITLDRERLWDKVSFSQHGDTHFTSENPEFFCVHAEYISLLLLRNAQTPLCNS